MCDDLYFWVYILVKIIIKFSDFSVFPIFVIFVIKLDANFTGLAEVCVSLRFYSFVGFYIYKKNKWFWA